VNRVRVGCPGTRAVLHPGCRAPASGARCCQGLSSPRGLKQAFNPKRLGTRQVIDLAGMSPINMLQYVRREDAQTEWQHNMDFCPETLNKVRARRPGVLGLGRASAERCVCCRGRLCD